MTVALPVFLPLLFLEDTEIKNNKITISNWDISGFNTTTECCKIFNLYKFSTKLPNFFF